MRSLSSLFFFLAAALSLAAAPTAQAQETVPAQKGCPGTVVVAARGSYQGNVGPQTYGTRTSNGWEGDTLRSFLRYAEVRYAATHGGESLLEDVGVLGVDKQAYPASLSGLRAQYDLAGKGPQQVWEYFAHAAQTMTPQEFLNYQHTSFVYSVGAAKRNIGGFIAGYEAASGCRPDYVYLGYSQGAMVLRVQERKLQDEGRLKGAVYIGNPLLGPGDAATVGDGTRAGGMVWGSDPGEFDTSGLSETLPRVEYCRYGDIVCDQSWGIAHLMYFQPWSPETEYGRQVADAFARQIKS